MINKRSKIFIAGHNGMVGSAVVKKLKSNHFKNLITVEKKKNKFFRSRENKKIFN